MKASEFIKKYGWDYAIHAGSEDAPLYINLDYKDLENYVSAWNKIHKSFDSVDIAYYEWSVSGCYEDPYWISVRQAINLVEECL